VSSRQFREDLFFRLSVFPITVPPLRERFDDVPILARFFIERFSKDLKKTPIELSPAAETALREYRWPGNVRELQNCIERAVILCETAELQPRHLGLSATAVDTPAHNPWDLLDLTGSLAEVSTRMQAEFEREKLVRALQESNGDQGFAADLLKINFLVL
jgi:Nif-specific regulatory protein